MKNEIIFLAGGDVQFDQVIRPERKILSISDINSRKTSLLKKGYYYLGRNYPRVFEAMGKYFGKKFEYWHFKKMNEMASYGNKFFTQYPLDCEAYMELFHSLYPNNEVVSANSYNFEVKNDNGQFSYPFGKIKEELLKSDICFVNLESPIAKRGRIRGMFRADPSFAENLKENGIHVVSIANNHALDASEEGFVETIENLENWKISYVGGGRNINEAKRLKAFKTKGTNFGFLAYTACSDNGFYDGVANEDSCGIMPLCPQTVIKDIRDNRDACDIMVLSLHWETANNCYVHPKSIEYAHQFIDSGVDIIVGHHPHVYKGIEVYRGKPIFYSLGNFVFGIYYNSWQDNILAKIHVREKEVREIEILPISGMGPELYQPEKIVGIRARNVIDDLKKVSSIFGTKIDLIENSGIIHLMD